MDKMKFLVHCDGIDYFLYKPSFFRLYANCYCRDDTPPYCSRLIHRVRMIREMICSHYSVVYMKHDGKIVGHLVVARGGKRIAMSKKDDIVIGPIWVAPSCRGKGFATSGINAILHHLGFEYDCAYEYILEDNAASIKTVVKNNFEFICKASEYGLFKTIKRNELGHILIFRYKKDEEQ